MNGHDELAPDRPATDRCIRHGEDIKVLENRLDNIDPKLDKIITLVEATNGRLRSVEFWRAWITGGVVMVLSALTATVTLFELSKHLGAK